MIARAWYSATRWWRPRAVVVHIDRDRGIVTATIERWSWRRWRWEREVPRMPGAVVLPIDWWLEP